MNRKAKAQMGQQTVEILNAGTYEIPAGERVDLTEQLKSSISRTRVIRPEEWPRILKAGLALSTPGKNATIEVTGETTLAAIARLVTQSGLTNIAALNFASAKNPGGGFLSGSEAQEESLARSSALFATLRAAPDYYAANRRAPNTLYTDHAILSPDVPVFRDDEGQLLARPYLTTFITMPAVNVGALPPHSPYHPSVPQVMKHRIECVLALAAVSGLKNLVLGAWGCGVFRNDPEQIAQLFAQSLSPESQWRTCFDRIVFAVYDPRTNGSNRSPFDRHFRP